VLKNKHDGKDDWVIIALADPSHKGNRHGVGARIELSIDDQKQTRWIIGGGPFQSNNTPQAHFGIGALPEDSTSASPAVVTVIWPDGERSTSTVARGMRTVVSKPAIVSK
jgi:hypothetical protein